MSKVYSMLEQDGREALCRLLNEVPGISDVEVTKCPANDFCDFVFRLHFPEGLSQKLFVEVKGRGERRFVEAYMGQMKNRAEPGDCVFVAPYLSEQSCTLLKDRGYNYMDLSGNCRIATQSVYIFISGQPNRYLPENKPGKYLNRSSSAASKVLRTMLNDPDKAWKVKELVEASDTSLGTVSNVKRFLIDNAWAEEVISPAAEGRAAGFRLRNVSELLRAWAKEYGKRSGDVREYYTLDSVPEFERNATQWRERHGDVACLGGFSAAARYAPVVRYNRAEVYVDHQDLREFIEDMELKAVSSGGNVLVMLPTDDTELMYTREIDGAGVTSPVQTVLDLIIRPGRGEEAAKAIIQKEFMDK